MTIRNGYCTLAEYKAYAATRGVTPPVSTADDSVIETMIEAASRRYEDDHYHRKFYPTVQTLLFDIPESRFLYFNEQYLLEMLTLTNGDSNTIDSTAYLLEPSTSYPKYGLKLRDSNAAYWALSSGSAQQVISVYGLWGFHDRYTTDGWVLGSTLTENLDTSELGFDVTAATYFSPGQIIRIGNELNLITSIAALTLTVIARGDNGSTAAAHTSGDNVYYWSPMTQVKNAVMEMVNVEYQARSQNSLGSTNPTRRWQSEGAKL